MAGIPSHCLFRSENHLGIYEIGLGLTQAPFNRKKVMQHA